MSDPTLIEIHRPLLGITVSGNLKLDTIGKLAGQVAAGNVPVFGGKGIPSGVTISNAAGTTNISNVTFQVSDLDGIAVAGNYSLMLLLSDATTGLGLTTHTASGGIAAASSGGTVILAEVASKALHVQTNSAGAFVLAITDSAKNLFVPVAYWAGRSSIGAALTAGSYG